MIKLRGITWDHPRGYAPLAASEGVYAERFGVAVTWERRSLQAFGDLPVDRLAERYDLLIIDHPHVGLAAEARCLAPLDELLPAAALDELAAQSAGPSHSSYFYAGHQWALAIDAALQTAAYREDLLSLDGSQRPASWDEVLALARRLAGGPHQVAIPLCPTDAICSLLTLMASLDTETQMSSRVAKSRGERGRHADHPERRSPDGLRPIPRGAREGSEGDKEIFGCASEISSRTERGRHDDTSPRPPLSASRALRALETLRELAGLCHPSSLDWNPIQMLDRMSHGDEIVYCPLTFCYTNYARSGYAPHLVRFAAIPGARGALLGGAGIAVSARCPWLAQAAGYAAWLCSADVQRGFYLDHGGQPGNRLAWEDPRANALAHNFFRDVWPSLEQAYVRPRHAGFVTFQEAAGRRVHDFLRSRRWPSGHERSEDTEDQAEACLADLQQLYRTWEPHR